MRSELRRAFMTHDAAGCLSYMASMMDRGRACDGNSRLEEWDHEPRRNVAGNVTTDSLTVAKLRSDSRCAGRLDGGAGCSI
jgi:hypothetical protein